MDLSAYISSDHPFCVTLEMLCTSASIKQVRPRAEW
jgi:hypothetical protein